VSEEPEVDTERVEETIHEPPSAALLRKIALTTEIRLASVCGLG
jgi:hypothetical protein